MNLKIEEDINNFYGTDLHVHTPASYCYKGPKEDAEYIEILRRYSLKNIKVIAITDHNTLIGYKKLMSIKKELVNKLQYLEELCYKFPDLKGEYDIIKSELDLFNNILILPGIEFEANPGIHLLMIFNPDSDLNKAESFLLEAGYTEDIQGKENTGITPKFDVLNVFNKSSDLDVIIIASHADSEKGIYNLEANHYRASIFRSSSLNGISYNNPINCQKMKGLLQNSEYKRQTPIAFIQCSDYHGTGEVGRCITYLKLINFSFDSVLSALSNPNECVSPTEHPKVINILKQIISDQKAFIFKNLASDDEKLEIKKAICALLNDNFGTIVIGASLKPDLNIIGIKLDNNQCSEELNKILNSIHSGFRSLSTWYPYGNEKSVVVIQLYSQMRRLYYLDNGEVYILKDHTPVKANPPQLQKFIENRLFNRMIEHEQIVKHKFNKLINEMDLLKESTSQFILINKLEKGSLLLKDIVNIKFINPYNDTFVIPDYNGLSSGNLYYVDYNTPRISDAYLRCSCPVTFEENIEHLNVQKFKGKAIVLVPGGGCYYIDNEEEWNIISLCEFAPTLVLQISEGIKTPFSELSLIGWLKSSALLLYSIIALEGKDIHSPEIFNKIIVPRLDIFKPSNEIEKLVTMLLNIEHKFLSTDIDMSEEEFSKFVNNHNRSIDKVASKIDKLIYEELNVTLSEIEMIKKFFRFEQIYDLSNCSDENFIVESDSTITEAAITI